MTLLGGVRAGMPCPCGSGRPYRSCCRPRHLGDEVASTAEDLVRSRYAAYAVGDLGYVVRTWHPRHRPAEVLVDETMTWTGLVVEEVVGGGVDDEEGVVTFRARWRRGATEGEMRERSRFVRRAGRWVYLDGDPL